MSGHTAQAVILDDFYFRNWSNVETRENSAAFFGT